MRTLCLTLFFSMLALCVAHGQNAMSVSAGTSMSEARPDHSHKDGCCKKLEDGVTKKYFPGTEKVRMETTYLNGKENGVQRLYYENGNLRMEMNYVDGKAHGSVKRYYEDGTLEEESNYANGELQGEVKSHDRSGSEKPK